MVLQYGFQYPVPHFFHPLILMFPTYKTRKVIPNVRYNIRSTHSTLKEAMAFVKTEGGWRCQHARKSAKNSTKFQKQQSSCARRSNPKNCGLCGTTGFSIDIVITGREKLRQRVQIQIASFLANLALIVPKNQLVCPHVQTGQ